MGFQSKSNIDSSGVSSGVSKGKRSRSNPCWRLDLADVRDIIADIIIIIVHSHVPDNNI